MLISMNDILQPIREHRFAIWVFSLAYSCFICMVAEEVKTIVLWLLFPFIPANMILSLKQVDPAGKVIADIGCCGDIYNAAWVWLDAR